MRMDFLTAVGSSVSPVERPALLAALQQEKFRLADERDKDQRAECKGVGESRDDTITIMVAAELDRIEEAELRVRMEQHEQALVQALIANEEALAAAQRTIDRLLGEAFVLPDGRRVFKTADGLRVFDENGQELAADEVDPDAIEDYRPSWEEVSAVKAEAERLAEERRELLDHQRKLDDAQEKMDAGTMTDADLADLDRLLTDDAPEAVRQRLSPETAPQWLPADASQRMTVQEHLHTDTLGSTQLEPF